MKAVISEDGELVALFVCLLDAREYVQKLCPGGKIVTVDSLVANDDAEDWTR